MRRASLNILTSFFILNFAYSQNLKTNSNTFVKSSFESFQSGEWIKFRIHYGIFNACYATINLKDTIVDNKKVFKSAIYIKELSLIMEWLLFKKNERNTLTYNISFDPIPKLNDFVIEIKNFPNTLIFQYDEHKHNY